MEGARQQECGDPAKACLTERNTGELRVRRGHFPASLVHLDCGRLGTRLRAGRPANRLEDAAIFKVSCNNPERVKALTEIQVAIWAAEIGVS